MCAAAACGRVDFDPASRASDAGAREDTAIDTPAAAPIIFATDATSLYTIDPVSLAETRLVTLFRADSMVVSPSDVAVSGTGTVLVFDELLPALLQVDTATGECTPVTLSAGVSMYGATYVPPGVVGPSETLLGAGSNKNLYTIEPTTGMMTLIGAMGVQPSGDIVWTGSELVMTVNGTPNDQLYRIDPVTAQATPIGDTGRVDIYGLARVGTTIFGTPETNDIVTVDPTTGAATTVANDTVGWSGASAPDG